MVAYTVYLHSILITTTSPQYVQIGICGPSLRMTDRMESMGAMLSAGSQNGIAARRASRLDFHDIGLYFL